MLSGPDGTPGVDCPETSTCITGCVGAGGVVGDGGVVGGRVGGGGGGAVCWAAC